MSIGSQIKVEDSEDQFREDCADLIAQHAAYLVAARDMSRKDAIAEVTAWMRNEVVSDSDPSGLAFAENEFPFPSKINKATQIAAIKQELMDAARDAADTL